MKSFQEWCKENNRKDWCDLWDYELNTINPTEVSYGSAKKFFFKCPKGIHKSELKILNSITNQQAFRCNCCNSIAQYLIDKNGNMDMWSTENTVDPYTTQKASNQKIKLICQDCGDTKEIVCSQFVKRETLGCKCGDGQSYPNKFVSCLLSQLKLNYETEKIFTWNVNKRYDHYIEEYNCIIENHGIQHYEERAKRTRTLKEEQLNDIYKEETAIANGIKEYITLDCRYSTLDYIRESIMKSKLPILLSFKENDIDWEECNSYATSNRVKQVCNLWNTNGFNSATELANYVGIDPSTTRDYLYKGSSYGWCVYDGKAILSKKGEKPNNAKKVYSKTLNKEFNSIKELADFLGKPRKNLNSYLSGSKKPTKWFIELEISYL